MSDQPTAREWIAEAFLQWNGQSQGSVDTAFADHLLSFFADAGIELIHWRTIDSAPRDGKMRPVIRNGELSLGYATATVSYGHGVTHWLDGLKLPGGVR